jgi:hypothetical protein
VFQVAGHEPDRQVGRGPKPFKFATINLLAESLSVWSPLSLTPTRTVSMMKKSEHNDRKEMHVERRRRKRPTTANEPDPVPDFMVRDAEADTSWSKITADDCAWLGEDGKLDPDELLKKRGYEPEGALRLILGAIIDAHVVVAGPTRSKRIDSAEATLLGAAQKRGNDPHDDEDLLRELGRRYFRKWLEDRDHIIEVAPLAREILAEAKASGIIPRDIVEGDYRRLQRKFVEDADRILARATAELRWNLPEFHNRILSILVDLRALGIPCDTRRILQRIGSQVENSAN